MINTVYLSNRNGGGVAWCDLSVLTTDNDDVDDGISIFSCQAGNGGRWSNGEDHLLRGGSCSHHVHGPFSVH